MPIPRPSPHRFAGALLLSGALCAPAAAVASGNGERDAVSQGFAIVTISVPDRIQISGAEDIALGSWSGVGDLEGSEVFCVYRKGSGLYDVTVTSANGAAGVFRAASGERRIPYTLALDDDVDLDDAPETPDGGTRRDLTGNGVRPDCGDGANAGIRVRFDQADLDEAPAGNYTDTITLLLQAS